MTLIVALRCRDGLIVGSDSQETRGARGRRLARSVRKVYEPRRGFLLACAGAQDAAQSFALHLERAHGLSPDGDRLEVKARLHAILEDVRADPSIEGRSDHVELLIAWWSRDDDKPVALHLLSGGAAVWVEQWAFGGAQLGIDSAHFAIGSMRYLNPDELALEQAKIVALKVLRDTIETSVEGVGGQVQMGTVEQRGVRLIGGADMRSLHDTVDLWEARCADILPGTAAPPSSSDTPDRGVLPPS